MRKIIMRLFITFGIIIIFSHNIIAQNKLSGKDLYMKYCATCHGAALEGDQNWRQRRPDKTMPAPPHDATGHT